MKTTKITTIFSVVAFMIAIMLVPVMINAQTSNYTKDTTTQKKWTWVKEVTGDELKAMLRGYKEIFEQYKNVKSFLKNYPGCKFLIVSVIKVQYEGCGEANERFVLDGIDPYKSKNVCFFKSYWEEQKMVKTVKVVVLKK